MRALLIVLLAWLPLAGCSGEPTRVEVTGVVVDVESRGLGEVEGFTVKDGAKLYNFSIDEDVDYGFDLGHLHAHRTSGDPVRVVAEERDEVLYAQSIEDA